MSDFLGTGVSALLAYRRALDTAGHNIANVNTPGYSRQRVELTARPGEPAGNGFIGNGVSSPTVQRLTDALLMTREIGDTASNARLSQFHALASQLDQSLSDADSSLAAPLDNFFNSFNTLAADPSSVAARQSLLGAAQTLASRFNQLDARMDTLNNEVEARLAAGVAELNQRAAQLATLNQRIALASGAAGGQPPNDLLDARDALARSLASQLGISTVVQADGQMNVFTGSGQALVLGNEAYALGTLKTPGQPMSLTYGSGAAAVDLTAQLGGGALGGLLDFRRELLAPAQLALGTLAQDLSAAVNIGADKINNSWLDQDGFSFLQREDIDLPSTPSTRRASMRMAIRVVCCSTIFRPWPRRTQRAPSALCSTIHAAWPWPSRRARPTAPTTATHSPLRAWPRAHFPAGMRLRPAIAVSSPTWAPRPRARSNPRPLPPPCSRPRRKNVPASPA